MNIKRIKNQKSSWIIQIIHFSKNNKNLNTKSFKMRPSEKYFIDKWNLELLQNHTDRLWNWIEKLWSKAEDIEMENLKKISDIIIQINGLVLTWITIFIAIKNEKIIFYHKIIVLFLIISIFWSIIYELWFKRKITKYFKAYFITYGKIFEEELSDFYSKIESNKISNLNEINSEKRQALNNEQKEDLSTLNYKSISENQEKWYRIRKSEIKNLMSDFKVLQEKIKCRRMLWYIILWIIFTLFLTLLLLILF